MPNDFLENAKPVKAPQDDFLANATALHAKAGFNTAPAGAHAAPGSLSSLLNEADLDLRQGGGRTLMGRTVGRLQGRGEKGMSGLESGTTPETAQIIGSPFSGPLHTAQGVAEIPSRPVQGLMKTASGIGETATLPTMFAAGPAAEAGAELIPSRKHAGAMLEDIESSLANHPVSLTKTNPAIDRFDYYRTHGGLGSKTVADTQTRLLDPNPVNFPEARMFYKNLGQETKPPSLLGRLIEEQPKPLLRRETGNVYKGLGEDLQGAAEAGGRGADYSNAMREYANAARVNRLLKNLGALGAGEAVRRSGLLGKVVSAGAKTP